MRECRSGVSMLQTLKPGASQPIFILTEAGKISGRLEWSS
jgi:hypothetical protein